MATSIPLRKSPFYRAAYFVEYDLPPEVDDDDVSKIIAMIDDDIAFEREVKTIREIKKPMVAQQNRFFAGVEPPTKWEWNNTKPSVRERILKGLMNKGNLAIMQKDRFLRNIEHIKTRNEKLRVLKECNEQLVNTWSHLDIFHSFDERISELRELVDDTYIFTPYLNSSSEQDVLMPNE